MKTEIEIKSIWGSVLFSHEKEDNTIKDTLQGAYLRGANLREADLQGANLRGANLQGANLDMCAYSLSCASLKFKSDLRIRTQMAFHFASLIANADQENVTDVERKIYSTMLEYVNRFHRTDVAKLPTLEP